MTLMGIVSTYQGLVIARFFLGVAEAGFFPAATYLLTICKIALYSTLSAGRVLVEGPILTSF